MKYRALDANGDYTFGGNGNCYLSGLDAVKQAISTRLKLLLYEWWEDLEDGLPLWQKILAQRDKTAAENAIKTRIEGTTGVKCILEFIPTWDNSARSLSIAVTVETEYGSTTIEEEVS